jgi:hypothetical protein
MNRKASDTRYRGSSKKINGARLSGQTLEEGNSLLGVEPVHRNEYVS